MHVQVEDGPSENTRDSRLSWLGPDANGFHRGRQRCRCRTGPNWDSGGTPTEASPSDSDIPDDTNEPSTPVDEWTELNETWRDCRGSLVVDESFTWTDADPACVITGCPVG